MNKILIAILICVILICVIGIFIYKKYRVITYNAMSEYKINIRLENKYSYIIWFNIETWNNGKKILFKKTTDKKDDFIVFIGDLTNILYIYSAQNNIKPNPIMTSYNGCITGITGIIGATGYDGLTYTSFPGIKVLNSDYTTCKKKCINDINCSGFVFDSSESVCYSINTPDNIFTTTPFDSTYCSSLSSELKLIEIKKNIPLQKLVKLVITFNNENMIVYMDDEIISNYYLNPTTISPAIITVTPTPFGFTGYTYFKYINKCLNYQEIKVLH